MLSRRLFATVAVGALMSAFVEAAAGKTAKPKPPAPSAAQAGANPFLAGPWETPFAAPPFDKIKVEHFKPAIEAGMAEARGELNAIRDNPAAPTFANTIVAMEKVGANLSRAASVFFMLTGADSNDEIEKLNAELSPALSKFNSDTNLDPKLFARVDAVKAKPGKLGAEEARLLEVVHRRFERAGARLDPGKKARFAEIDQRLSTISVEFDKRVLADTKAYTFALESEADRAGLPDFLLAAARANGKALGRGETPVISISRSSVEPFLTFSPNRALREKAWRAWISRGDNNDANDTKALISETIRLRTEKAQMLGFKSYADYSLADQMAKTPEAAEALMAKVWAPAVKAAARDVAEMQAMVDAEGGGFKLAAWDYRYYAEKLRKAKYDLDETEIKPYFQIDKVIDAVADTSGRLFGVSMKERKDIPAWRPEVRVWEVFGAGGKPLGLFFGDYYMRPSKQGGAWMSSFRDQEKLRGDRKAVVFNVCNFSKGEGDQPSLLSFDDAETLFHEFGHALHGLLSNVTYPTLSGTSTTRDFVEYPSQVMEHWISEPQILSKYARHYKTGAPMPQELLERIKRARNFNQGFATVEYLASAIVDMDLHRATDPSKDIDIAAFEKATLAKYGMPAEIVMRHRLPHFGHIMGGYAAGYYAYLWSEVLDADTFAAFTEKGDVFDPVIAAKLKSEIFSRGGSRDEMESFVAFRGRKPDPQALLRARGFA